jgi:hypothetical protein
VLSKFHWLGIALVVWSVFALFVAWWLAGSDLRWWDIKTWLTPLDQFSDQEKKWVRTIQIDQLRNLFGVLVVLLGSLVGAIQIGNSLHRTHLLQATRDSDQERLNAEVYSKAVEQLGSDRSATRLGAIYSLEALALSNQISGETHLTSQIMETLASFVRERSDEFRKGLPTTEGTLVPSPSDIAAAFVVLTRSYPQETRPSLETGGIDLRRSYLVGLRLYQGTDLRSFNLSGSDLANSSLYGCDLRGIWLSGANLTGARLTKARVDKVYFTNVSWGDCKGLTDQMLKDIESWDNETNWPSYLATPDLAENANSKQRLISLRYWKQSLR